MPTYNGLVCRLIKGSSTGGEDAVITGTSRVSPVSAVPSKIIRNAMFAVQTQGVSGSYGVQVVCSIGGSTSVVAGITTINADGSRWIGSTASLSLNTFPRVAYVAFGSAVANAGFTSTVTMCGFYD